MRKAKYLEAGGKIHIPKEIVCILYFGQHHILENCIYRFANIGASLSPCILRSESENSLVLSCKSSKRIEFQVRFGVLIPPLSGLFLITKMFLSARRQMNLLQRHPELQAAEKTSQHKHENRGQFSWQAPSKTGAWVARAGLT